MNFDKYKFKCRFQVLGVSNKGTIRAKMKPLFPYYEDTGQIDSIGSPDQIYDISEYLNEFMVLI